MRRALLAGLLLTLAHAAYSQEVGSVICPDGQSECPDANTCCKLVSGQWGCCPLPQAVCCSDKVHCCPHGYKCDVGGARCLKGELTVPWSEKNIAAPVQVGNVNTICPGGRSQCPSGSTCCLMTSGRYACCPLPHAVCCSDHLHCCPQGYTCNVAQGTCLHGDLTVPWEEKTVAMPVEVHSEGGQICPNSSSICRDTDTCCKLTKTTWGCCPEPNAVCCSDMKHCCPHGTKCNKGACVGESGTTPALTKTQAKEMGPKVETIPWFTKTLARTSSGINGGDIPCDQNYICPDGNTCCKLASGQWGCCPLPEAVCCSDGIHCCPNGQTCDVESGSCNSKMEAVVWSTKTHALAAFDGSVQCDSTYSCPDSNTCCILTSGSWGCCPMPQAVCCSDKEHCCPHGTTCDVSEGKCNSKTKAVGWTTETLALSVGAASVQCDATHYCPSGNTCCRQISGQWGCCPLPVAVCCSDKLHCCPNGYTCNVATGSCQK